MAKNKDKIKIGMSEQEFDSLTEEGQKEVLKDAGVTDEAIGFDAPSTVQEDTVKTDAPEVTEDSEPSSFELPMVEAPELDNDGEIEAHNKRLEEARATAAHNHATSNGIGQA